MTEEQKSFIEKHIDLIESDNWAQIVHEMRLESVSGIGGSLYEAGIDDFLYHTSKLEAEWFKKSDITNIRLPKNITTINNYAFSDCVNLESVVLPDNLQVCGFSLFKGCSNLQDVNIPKTLDSIPSSTFCYCNSLHNIVIPNNIKHIGHGAFYECKSLTSINIPSTVEYVDHTAFAKCDNLTSIDLSHIDNTVIGSHMFSNCSSLANIALSKYIQKIDLRAFEWCTSLKNITLPKSLRYISDEAFSHCGHIYITFEGSKQDWHNIVLGRNVFLDTDVTCKCTDGIVRM